MNKQIRRLGAALMLCFVALFVQLNMIQVYGQTALEENSLNTRSIIRDFGQPRGVIATADGVVIARSVETGGQLQRQREYPEPELFAHITGFFSLNFGADGVEAAYNDELSGQTIEQQYSSLSDVFRDQDTTADVTLTIRSDVQQVARDALGDRPGSVVALDPRTGAVLALWSYPSYDPNLLSANDLDAANVARGALLADPDRPLLARTYREIFFPGSTFKVVTATAGFESGLVNPGDPVFEVATSYTPPLTTLPLSNFAGSSCGGDVIEALRVSCNTAFAEMGAEVLGPGPLIETAEAFGFNQTPPFDLPAPAASSFPTDFGAVLAEPNEERSAPLVENTPLLAQVAIGQNEVAATPLEMALVAAAVANEGRIMSPHVMDEIQDASGEVVDRYEPSIWRSPMRPSTASIMRSAMITVAESGTATGLQIPGFEIGGKTGSAQVDASRPDDTHAWIIGFAGPPGQAPEVAVAVLVESREGAGQQTGGTVAAPIARAVLEAALAPMTPVLSTEPTGPALDPDGE